MGDRQSKRVADGCPGPDAENPEVCGGVWRGCGGGLRVGVEAMAHKDGDGGRAEIFGPDADQVPEEEEDGPYPGDLETEPKAKMVFNAPFSEKNVYNLRLTNNSAHCIGWAIKTNHNERLTVDPPAGCLNSMESQIVRIACEPFQFGVKDGQSTDRVSFWWAVVAEGKPPSTLLPFPQRIHSIPVVYNP